MAVSIKYCRQSSVHLKLHCQFTAHNQMPLLHAWYSTHNFDVTAILAVQTLVPTRWSVNHGMVQCLGFCAEPTQAPILITLSSPSQFNNVNVGTNVRLLIPNFSSITVMTVYWIYGFDARQFTKVTVSLFTYLGMVIAEFGTRPDDWSTKPLIQNLCKKTCELSWVIAMSQIYSEQKVSKYHVWKSFNALLIIHHQWFWQVIRENEITPWPCT